MKNDDTDSSDNAAAQAKAEDIFDEDGALSRAFLRRRGFCCENGCKNCPYGFRKPGGAAAKATPS